MTSVQEVLEKAIQWEEYVFQFYSTEAKKPLNKEVRALFLKLANEELKHKHLLSEVDFKEEVKIHHHIPWFDLSQDIQNFKVIR